MIRRKTGHGRLNSQGNISNEYFGKNELVYSEQSLQKYTDEIVKELLKGYQPKAGEKILDFGAGTGQLAKIVEEITGISPTCMEIDKQLIDMLETRGFLTVNTFTQLEPSTIDFVYSSNVLEHIENDTQTLQDIHTALVPGGTISIFVPALPLLYSDFDRKVGHFRRYTRKEIELKLSAANFQVVELKYFDFFGIFAWLWMKAFPLHQKNESEITGLMKIYDSFVFPLSRALDKCGLSKLAGKNLIVRANKIDGNN